MFERCIWLFEVGDTGSIDWPQVQVRPLIIVSQHVVGAAEKNQSYTVSTRTVA